MSGFLDNSDGKSHPKKVSKPSNFGKKEKENRGGFKGGLIGHVANAAVTGIGMALGFKAMGPMGMAGGALASQAAGETAKHYASSFFGSRPSSGGASSFSNIGELRTAVGEQNKSALDGGDTTVSGVKTRLEEALNRINSATDGSSHSAVDEMRNAVTLAISLCDTSVLTASRSAQQKAASWAGGL